LLGLPAGSSVINKPFTSREFLRAIQYPTIGIGLFFHCRAPAELRITYDTPLLTPMPGAYQTPIPSHTVLELTLITTKSPDPARVEPWGFVNDAKLSG